MKYLFGPVNSRRLGISLGIDLVPLKTCSLNCVYCECGGTDAMTTETAEYVPTADVIRELAGFLSERPVLDAVTFSGSGEPTLHSGLGEIIRFLKRDFGGYRVVILTNGTLMGREEVRRAVLDADIIIPSLDAAGEHAFRRVCRPPRGVTAGAIIEGLVALRNEYDRAIFLEIFIVPGVNDTASELERMLAACRRIRPDRIQINTLDRPGAEEWVRPADARTLEWVRSYFSEFPVEILGRPAAAAGEVRVGDDGLRESILSTVERRPSTLEDLCTALGAGRTSVEAVLDGLLREGEITVAGRDRGAFYKKKGKKRPEGTV
jgi:wyosine [tRNA(Phe)-imidazoG37] synthetase (radical SAM superfamily)